MPPWLPAPGYGDFEGDRRLTAEQIAAIAEWVRAGAPEGDAADKPAPPNLVRGWQLGAPDLVLQARQPLSIPAGGPDVFWNFVFAPQLGGTRYVRALEIRPSGDQVDAARQIHHANLVVDRTGSARRLEATPGAGFGGMELALDRNPLDPPSHFLFWKPGSVPASEPDDMPWRLDPGNLLVLNTHIQPSGKPETVQPSIGLYFTAQKPIRFPLLIELENDDALNIPPGARDFVVADDFRLPVDSDVLAIYPHAHYLGKRLEAYATRPDGRRVALLCIPAWNLDWQAVYHYRKPVFLPRGSVLSMRFQYDNSAANPRNPNSPPRRVRAGNNAADEMAHLWLQLLPHGARDERRTIEQALLAHRLERHPDDFSAHLNLGALLLSRLQTQAAIDQLETALRLHAQSAEARDMLGSALRSLGQTQPAIRQYRLALQADPAYIEARYDLATALARTGRMEEAIAQFRPVLAAFPASSRLQNEMGELLAQTGDLAGALQCFDKALQVEPQNEEARRNRGWVTTRQAGKKASVHAEP